MYIFCCVMCVYNSKCPIWIIFFLVFNMEAVFHCYY